ncbi:MAG TPA: YbaK/EbsC family protein [Polyangiales bacterium]|nr:YbaK/EbsC family protein [Polyangiales bacterium]
MFVSHTVMSYLDRLGVEHDVLTHRHTACSSETANAADIERSKLAKAVLMRCEGDYVLAVVPASRHVNTLALKRLLGSDEVALADEDELPYIFRDCETGAIPIVGGAFGLKTAFDDELLRMGDVYFEAGDHEHLVHVNQAAFARLVGDEPHGTISRPMA